MSSELWRTGSRPAYFFGNFEDVAEATARQETEDITRRAINRCVSGSDYFESAGADSFEHKTL
jgi:hypothetical protein